MGQDVNIIVVDDELGVRESFKLILTRKDYKVDAFEDGEAALLKFKKGAYDFAFIDYKLTGMDGIQFLKRIKEIDPDIEAAIVTAYASESSHANAIDLGAIGYLRKPFLQDDIYELVEKGLRKRKAQNIK